MKQVRWLLQKGLWQEEEERLSESLRYLGFHFEFCKYNPFMMDNGYLNIFQETDCVIFYGSLNMAAQIRSKTPWVPGLFHTLPHYRCSSYYPKLGDFLFNGKYIMLPFGELVRCKDLLFDSLTSSTSSLFVRPDRGDKIFTGKLISAHNWKREIGDISCLHIDANEICIVASPRNVIREWRIFVSHGEIITGSQYRPRWEAGIPSSVERYAQEVLKVDFNPDRVWCLDICEGMGGDLFVMEVGGFSCAGLYRCDTDVLAEVVSREAEKEWRSVNEVDFMEQTE